MQNAKKRREGQAADSFKVVGLDAKLEDTSVGRA
jgi:hypothetical protein